MHNPTLVSQCDYINQSEHSESKSDAGLESYQFLHVAGRWLSGLLTFRHLPSVLIVLVQDDLPRLLHLSEYRLAGTGG